MTEPTAEPWLNEAAETYMEHVQAFGGTHTACPEALDLRAALASEAAETALIPDRLYRAMVTMNIYWPGAFNVVAINKTDTRTVAEALVRYYTILGNAERAGLPPSAMNLYPDADLSDGGAAVVDEMDPTCDICSQLMVCNRGCDIHVGDWNGETGNHLSCESMLNKLRELVRELANSANGNESRAIEAYRIINRLTSH